MIFDLPTYHVQQFLPYNVQFWGVIFDLPTLKSDVINGRSLIHISYQLRRLTNLSNAGS